MSKTILEQKQTAYKTSKSLQLAAEHRVMCLNSIFLHPVITKWQTLIMLFKTASTKELQFVIVM
jgi:hypothetical protein